jgi:hypothetical protein
MTPSPRPMPSIAGRSRASQQKRAAHVRLGSFASDQSRQQLRPMSALPPIATKLVRRNEVTLCAKLGHHAKS